MNKKELQFILKKHNILPNKIRGQNFLISDEVLNKIINAAAIDNKDLILEIGAGPGILTSQLIEWARQVISFEIDKNFFKLLSNLEKIAGNLKIIWQDILSLSDDQLIIILKEYKAGSYKIVANIPYYLTGKFIRKFIMSSHKPQTMTLMVQKEVAERIIAKNNKQSLLSLSVSVYARAELVDIVDKNNFYPAPKVDSAIIRIYNIHNWNYQVGEKFFWQTVHRGFASKRKKLFNNLLSDQNLNKDKLNMAFDKAKLDKNIRAEALSLDNWLDLLGYI